METGQIEGTIALILKHYKAHSFKNQPLFLHEICTV